MTNRTDRLAMGVSGELLFRYFGRPPKLGTKFAGRRRGQVALDLCNGGRLSAHERRARGHSGGANKLASTGPSPIGRRNLSAD